MGVLRQVTRGVRALLRRGDDDRDIADEVEHFMAEAEADLVSRGATPEEARRRVRQRYGDAVAVREDVRAYGWESLVEAFWADLRYAARRLRKSPGFAAVAIITLGLGIGSSTALFSVVRPVLFAPLAYPHAERVVSVSDLGSGGAPVPVTFGTYREVQQRSRVFAALAVSRSWQPVVTGRGEPERLRGARVSAAYFQVLGMSPVLGPGFAAKDDRVGGPDVVILSDALWRNDFAADSTILGRVLRLDDRPFTVVGVMPRGFEDVPGHPTELWSLLQYDASLPSFDGREWGHHLEMIGRLEAGVSPGAARADLDRIATSPVPELTRPSWADMSQGLAVRGVVAAATAGARPALLALMGAAALLLAIACVNVTNLVLARGARRRGEMAMRAALGAARGRVARQLVVESLLLAVLGGALGVVVAALGVGAIVAVGSPSLPRLDRIALDGGALGFALGVTALVGIIVGLVPVLATRRSDLYGTLHSASIRTGGSHLSARRTLVVVQVALALVLLAGAGLLARSMQRLFAVSPGFDASQRVAMKVQVAGRRFDDDASTNRFFAQALEAVRQVPGVLAAAVTSQLPLSGDPLDQYGMNLETDPRPDQAGRGGYRYAVSPGYFRAMGIPLLRGRALNAQDVSGAPRVVVVDQAFARSAFPGEDPVGRRIHAGSPDQPWYTIVGVVADVKQPSLAEAQADAFYVTADQWYFADRARWLVVRSARDAAALVPALKQAVWSVDPDQPVLTIAAMQEVVARSETQRRFAMQVLETFAILALALAGIGLYGVLSGSVAERLPEMGVRAALGASRERLVRLVVRQGMVLTGVGVLLGLLGAAVAGRLLASLLFGVSPLDPATYLGVVGVLVGVAAVACWVPAVRASRADPVSALRTD